MALPTVTWNPESPAGSDALNAGDDAIQAFKNGLAERLLNGGHGFPVDGSGPTVVATDGRHACGVAFTAGATGGELAGEFIIFAADKTTAVVIVRDSTAATPSEVFFGANKVRTTGNVSAATGTFTGAVTIGTLTTGTLTTSGHLVPGADNTYDIGTDITADWRDLFLQRNAKIGGTLDVTGATTFGANIAMQQSTSSAVHTVLSGTYSVLTADRIVVFTVNCTITLPAASTMTGKEIWLVAGNNATSLTINRSGADVLGAGADTTFTIDATNAASVGSIHLYSNGGTRWYVLGNASQRDF